MPIHFDCPECDAPIKAASSKAGLKIDCPECDARVRVPDDEEPPPPPKKKRPASRDDEADDRPSKKRASARDDDDDDRPSKKRSGAGKKRKKAGPSKNLIIGLAIGAALLFVVCGGGGGYLIYRMTRPGGDKQMAGVDWYKADHPDGMFTAYFPGDKPKYEKVGFTPSNFLVKKSNSGMKAEEMGFSSELWTRKEDGREYVVTLLTLPGQSGGNAAEAAFAQIMVPKDRNSSVNLATDESITLGGRPARKVVTRSGGRSHASIILGVGGRQVLTISVSGDNTVTATDEKVKAFFDNFTLHK